MKLLIDANNLYNIYNSIITPFIEEVDNHYIKELDLRTKYNLTNYQIFMKYGVNYINNDSKIIELYYQTLYKIENFFTLLLETSLKQTKKESIDIKSLLKRLKRNKKQTITLCLELLSIEFDEEIRNLMRTISNKKHTWKIVQDKKLEYSWDFIESIFD
jgi:hypothetical protein